MFKKIKKLFEFKKAPNIKISGAGILSIDSNELLQCEEVQKQIKILKDMKDSGRLTYPSKYYD